MLSAGSKSLARSSRIFERSLRSLSSTNQSTLASQHPPTYGSCNTITTAMRANFPSLSQSRYFSTNYAPNPLDAFRDPVDRQTRGTEPVGRSWSVKELRRKSYEDLHKLWYVLYKEKNMLLTEQQLSRRRQLNFPQPERMYKVQKSMGAIKHVLGERKREKVAAHLASQMEKAMMAESEEQTEEMDEVAEQKL